MQRGIVPVALFQEEETLVSRQITRCGANYKYVVVSILLFFHTLYVYTYVALFRCTFKSLSSQNSIYQSIHQAGPKPYPLLSDICQKQYEVIDTNNSASQAPSFHIPSLSHITAVKTIYFFSQRRPTVFNQPNNHHSPNFAGLSLFYTEISFQQHNPLVRGHYAR